MSVVTNTSKKKGKKIFVKQYKNQDQSYFNPTPLYLIGSSPRAAQLEQLR
jgi:hypothetical protein